MRTVGELSRAGGDQRPRPAPLRRDRSPAADRPLGRGLPALLTQYEAQARERWGDTDAYRESAWRTAGYGEPEWSQIRAEADQLVRDFAALMSAGEPARGDAARVVAQRHRAHMTRWFYPVSTEMHRHLAEMYVADPRFTDRYERVASGLAAYVHDAVLANADAIEEARFSR